MTTPGTTPRRNPRKIRYKETPTCSNKIPVATISKNVSTIAVGGGKKRISNNPVLDKNSHNNNRNIGDAIVSICFQRSFLCLLFHSLLSISNGSRLNSVTFLFNVHHLFILIVCNCPLYPWATFKFGRGLPIFHLHNTFNLC